MLVLFDGWTSLFRDRVVPWRIGMAEKMRKQLESRGAAAFIAGRSAGTRRRASPCVACDIADHVEWKPRERSWLLTLARVERASGETETYFLPLALAWEDRDEDAAARAVRLHDREGAPAGTGRRARRCVRRRGFRARAGRGHAGRASCCRRRAARCISSRRPRSRESRAATSPRFR